MRYLQNRENFLNKRVELDRSKVNDYYKSSKMIREVYENDITWGGSLVGRLINSTIRLFKAGIKTAQMPAVINSLKSELDSLLISSTQGEMKEKIDRFRLKAMLEQIKTISLEPSGPGKLKEEIDILDKLIGLKAIIPGIKFDDIPSSKQKIKDEIYNPNDPTKNSRTEGVVQRVMDTIEDDLPELELSIGVNKDLILDTLSDFNDRLRKYVYQLTGEDAGGSTSDASTSIQRFTANFSQVITAIAKSKSKSTI